MEGEYIFGVSKGVFKCKGLTGNGCVAERDWKVGFERSSVGSERDGVGRKRIKCTTPALRKEKAIPEENVTIGGGIQHRKRSNIFQGTELEVPSLEHYCIIIPKSTIKNLFIKYFLIATTELPFLKSKY